MCRASTVVFGELEEGFETLGKMEAIGSASGATAKRVVIEDCGELPM